ncbi:hypothetical protein Geu3261_0037_068 [Komagataeibacter europaeus NBRC 3261]|uniref:Uncharacterized protein n=1 Tax=Komagataeibacter europaeus NBRC 3261 TaxID=1234669 RepID=A0A0D6PWY7_KOMEU|nr:hypothetical protein Geu3261_0037_068 [Komagataeibacter europaeus NBRC 3261]GBQ39692.1 hypothetical protein AA18890_0545 [Komagataeibacter europaeus LMG 18890]
MAGSAVVRAVPSICSIIMRLATISAMIRLRARDGGVTPGEGGGNVAGAVVKGDMIMHDIGGTEP